MSNLIKKPRMCIQYWKQLGNGLMTNKTHNKKSLEIYNIYDKRLGNLLHKEIVKLLKKR